MPTAQWTEPLGHLERKWGLDRTERPAWLLVVHDPLAGKVMRLEFGAGKRVSVVNEHICRVKPTDAWPGDADASYFWFEGLHPGNTRVEVRAAGKSVPETTLSVTVLPRRQCSLVFHFVTDRGGNRTLRQPGDLHDLVKQLNAIFPDQTAVSFETDEAGSEVRVPFDIVDAVYEEKDPTDRHRGTNWGALIGRRNWEKVFRSNNATRSLNIYLTPTDTAAADNANALPYVDLATGTCVIEDGREPLDIMLPHAIGRLLGCPPRTANRSHLMFWDATSRRTGDFIPKSCALIVNQNVP